MAATPLIWGVLIAIALAALVRVAFTYGRTRDMAPAIFLLIGLIVLGAAYSISRDAPPAAAPPPTAVEAMQ
jgi:predicted membrane channel-forming protein YqfA (hemolysin III family)